MKIRTELDDIGDTLARLKYQLLGIKFELKLRKWSMSTKAGFDPDQPRDELGMWSDGGGSGSTEEASSSGNQVAAIFADFESLPLAARLEALLGSNSNDLQPTLQPAAAKVTYSTARTGIQKIDDTTNKLSEILVKTMDTMDIIPDSTPSVYGVAVHKSFANAVIALDLPGVGRNGVEQTFSLTDAMYYGAAESIRTDVLLRNDDGDIIAIYDLKTGGATLKPGRVAELRAKTRSSPDVPVIELHFYRGSRLKYEPLSQGLPFVAAAIARHGDLRRLSRHHIDRLYR